MPPTPFDTPDDTKESTGNLFLHVILINVSIYLQKHLVRILFLLKEVSPLPVIEIIPLFYSNVV